jgi:hyperosmotically inducible periplasmic protein
MVIALSAAIPALAQEAPADPTASPAAVVQVDVEAVAAQVTRALVGMPGVPPDSITVSTHANTIVLSGKVDNEAQREAAMAAAQKAAGGVRISPNVEVRPLQERSTQEQQAAAQSAQLVREVEAALKADSRTANLGITVSSADPHKVVLQGLVPAQEHRTAAQNVVSKVKGVTHVDNQLRVP